MQKGMWKRNPSKPGAPEPKKRKKPFQEGYEQIIAIDFITWS